ncbi:Uncharacterised protein [Vibrio cholerae]|uniref:Uncharacterized protein n=1 Tax=Vibrio cholerae TaxID=666 RepID=A0A655RCS9_VIBCL|nr:Uncharacterised protein [Vibrio cholerae]
MLIATRPGKMPCSFQRLTVAKTSRITTRPKCSIKPAFSATGMKAPGLI